MPKLLRARKKFARCHVEGHGQNHVQGFSGKCCCVVNDDIQNTPITRAFEKIEWKKEVITEITEIGKRYVGKS